MLKLYNSRTYQKEVFTPLDPIHVRFYVCGPTVYSRCHIGNARPVVVFDVLYRVLSTLYAKVSYVRNITDVDDKIIHEANKRSVPIHQLTKETTEMFHKDMECLGAIPPTHEPRATEYIEAMIKMIQILIAKGAAYVAKNHVLFRIASFKGYGTLSNRRLEDMIAGARVEIAPYKESPCDFVLWKPSLEGEVGFESPFGLGRPGWHIECSAMSAALLGETFDIHGGGVDLMFPHHENEIAQSCMAFDTPFMANYWMHNGHVTVEGEKMSKSLGNIITLDQALLKAKGEVIRLALLSSHYRQPLDWTDELIVRSQGILDRFYQALQDGGCVFDGDGEIDKNVMEALLDDLNIPKAMARLHEIAGSIFKETDLVQKRYMQSLLKGSGRLLGILISSSWFQQSLDEDGVSSSEIETLLEERRKAKLCRDFKRADEIRDQLSEGGILIQDSPSGATWRYK